MDLQVLNTEQGGRGVGGNWRRLDTTLTQPGFGRLKKVHIVLKVEYVPDDLEVRVETPLSISDTRFIGCPGSCRRLSHMVGFL
jgi:hypothetical protein